MNIQTGQPTAVGAGGTRPQLARPDLSLGRAKGREMAYLSKEEYVAKLRDPRWQKLRLQVLQRDEFTCQKCFDSKSMLSVHHKWYGSGEPWDIPLHALITLCESCHEEETVLLPDYAHDVVRMLKQCGAMYQQFYALASALIQRTDDPLTPYEWDVVIHALDRLLSFETFDRARDEYQAWCAQRAAAAKLAPGQED